MSMPNTDIPSVTAEQMREVDRRAVEDYGIEIIQLMENAAYQMADFLRSQVKIRGMKFVSLVGKGNNGGDAIAVTRHLKNWGGECEIVLSSIKEKINELSQKQLQNVEKMGIPIIVSNDSNRGKVKKIIDQSDVLIDGLVGYSITGALYGEIAQLVEMANNSGQEIVSFDLPSGLDPDTGESFGKGIRAKWTVTLALPKIGIVKKEAREYVGKLYLADISIPEKLYSDLSLKVPRLFEKRSIIPL
ncbi:NAD(P)H-hydrate epimerase [Patescibacteria group bacterium]